MKKIGLVGGTGWISTAEYYRIINQEANRRRGGLNFAECLVYSLDYGRIDACNRRSDIAGVYELVLGAARSLVSVGAEAIVLCANTLHRFAGDLEKEIPVPLVHIASETARAIRKAGLERVALLGTRQTMELDFYFKKLRDENIIALVPDPGDRIYIQKVISEELLHGIIREESRARFLEIIDGLRDRGAEGAVLGCTEIPLLIKQIDLDMPLFDTLEIHARAAVDFALRD